MRNLGIFALGVGALVIVIILFFLIRLCCAKISCCKKLGTMVHKKIFFSGPIRYVVVGYLKLMNQFL